MILFSCTKNAIDINPDDIVGTWKEVLITGGIAGIREVPADDTKISFHLDRSYTVSRNDTITDEGKYSLSKAPEPNYYYTKTVINFSSKITGNSTYGIYAAIDSLSISGGCCDQFTYTYKKVN